ncbi:MAG: lactate utilization protein [Acholeplasmatales bacterium]|nr:lactate utilization protein [Acholeplasmatales bacterium]
MDLNEVKFNLEKRGFKVSLFENGKEVVSYLNKEIDNTTVGIGGSVTVKELGLFDELKTHNTVWWHNDNKQALEYGVYAIRCNAANTDIYISSVNAMSKDGIMINLDATGNRIASTVWGHKKCYYIIGVNKIEDDFEKAYNHVKNISAPRNVKRLNLKTPCAVKGDKCYNCNCEAKICRTFMIYEAPSKGQDIEIIIVNQTLGY